MLGNKQINSLFISPGTLNQFLIEMPITNVVGMLTDLFTDHGRDFYKFQILK